MAMYGGRKLVATRSTPMSASFTSTESMYVICPAALGDIMTASVPIARGNRSPAPENLFIVKFFN